MNRDAKLIMNLYLMRDHTNVNFCEQEEEDCEIATKRNSEKACLRLIFYCSKIKKIGKFIEANIFYNLYEFI